MPETRRERWIGYGKRVRRLREDHLDLTRKKFTECINAHIPKADAVNEYHIRNWERGGRPPVSITKLLDKWMKEHEGPPVFTNEMWEPDWASNWGNDRFGRFVEITVASVIQRLRWIPPGRFWMGSPEDEEGRENDEGPRHEVTLAAGFWLFDTPCTQVLWEAVMGENPSHFRSPTQPVEYVSFEDVQRFLKVLNNLVPGLALTLPSEAQWEYACRAGTDTATYAGPMRILTEHNAPVLDQIAWYGGNIGSRRPKRNRGAQLVTLKAPNSWGLYDTLGNVWEWCADHMHRTYDGAPTDGAAWPDRDGHDVRHVFRGGSWRDPARYVRAAFRGHDPRDTARDPHAAVHLPELREADLGFRCARVQAVSQASGVARATGPGKPAEE